MTPWECISAVHFCFFPPVAGGDGRLPPPPPPRRARLDSRHPRLTSACPGIINSALRASDNSSFSTRAIYICKLYSLAPNPSARSASSTCGGYSAATALSLPFSCFFIHAKSCRFIIRNRVFPPVKSAKEKIIFRYTSLFRVDHSFVDRASVELYVLFKSQYL